MIIKCSGRYLDLGKSREMFWGKLFNDHNFYVSHNIFRFANLEVPVACVEEPEVHKPTTFCSKSVRTEIFRNIAVYERLVSY